MVTWCVVTCSPSIRPAAAENSGATTRPNVLFVLAEDQGAHLSMYGTAGLQTPNIDSLARRGTSFNSAFVVYPVCSASKAAIYTGLHNHTNGLCNNTLNFHQPAATLDAAQRDRPLYRRNRIADRFETLIERLDRAGYYTGVTHKLHVAPNDKFPYDEFLDASAGAADDFLRRRADSPRPWFLMVNLPQSHRPYPNSLKESVRVDPDAIDLPKFLPDLPPVRRDWAEYLAGIERVDGLVGRILQTLDQTGQTDDTIVIYFSDHGPTFPHGKMTLYDLGLRVPLIIAGPNISPNIRRDDLVTELDLLPTLVEKLDLDFKPDYQLHGSSLSPLLNSDKEASASLRDRRYVFAEISNRGPLPCDGIQERAVFDGRYRLIYRTNVDSNWRQVNADSRQSKLWGNRSYQATIDAKSSFPEAFRVLREMDPQTLGGPVPPLELYDGAVDPDEMVNRVHDPDNAATKARLVNALADWIDRTDDPAVDPADLRRVASASEFPIARSIKGLQVEDAQDAVSLGVDHATFNVLLPRLLASKSSNRRTLNHQIDGRTLQLDANTVERLDADVKTMSDAGALVYLILLNADVAPARRDGPLNHPGNTGRGPNRITAFNTVTPIGRQTLSDIAEFLSSRYGGPTSGANDGKHGRVVGYIVGNEVNSHWWWYHRGEVAADELMDQYVDAFEIVTHAVRRHTPWARTYVSLDHFWTRSMAPNLPRRGIAGRDFLLGFAQRCADRKVPWHLAYHPYPTDLFDPRFWNDAQATDGDDTPIISFKNLPVLTRFMNTPRMRNKPSTRSIILSEQGFHSDATPEGEQLQAAAFCLAYERIGKIPDIDAFVLHRHIDHPGEGGLNLGLYRRPAHAMLGDQMPPGPPRTDPELAKPIHACFRDADTPRRGVTFEPHLNFLKTQTPPPTIP